MIPINYLAVVAAAVASMALGALWYGPVFGKKWIALMGFTQADMERGMKNSMGSSYGVNFVGALVTAYVLAHFVVVWGVFTGNSGLSLGLMTGFWSWLGFMAPVTLATVIWEGKSWHLWILNNGYNLANLLIAGAILALWQ